MWIESHQSLARHPKTKRLSRLLNASIPAVIGYLHLFWWWAMEYADDGSLVRYDAADISDAAMWEGEPEKFLSGLLSAGFVDERDDGLHIHDWRDYAGKLLDKRRSDAERKRNSRVPNKDVQRMSIGRPTDGARNLTVPNLTVPNKTKPRDTICTEQNGDAVSSMPPEPEEKPKAVIFLTLNDKSEYPITEKQVTEWSELYPAVDVMQQLRAMKGWLDANPKGRKTKTGILRFANAWLSKEQNKGGVKHSTKNSVNKDYSSSEDFLDFAYERGGKP